MDVSQYLEIFIDETKEHLQSLNEQLLILEKEPENAETINEIFRAAHTLKGMAGTMGYKRMQSMTHNMENVFSEIRNGKMSVTAMIIDVLFKGLDALENYLANISSGGDEGTEEYAEINGQLEQCLKQGLAGSAEATVAAAPAATATQVATEVSEAADAKEKYKAFTYADHEKHAMTEAIAEGQHAYGITVLIQETCLLKAARAFLVFKTLEDIGTVIKSEPSVQDIEDEKFEFDFSLVLLTKENAEKVKQLIMAVSEVDSAYVGEIDQSKLTIVEESRTETTESVTKTVEQNTAAAVQAAPAKEQKKAATQTAGKAVASRSVRVDIEKLDDLMNLVSELIIAKNGLVSINNTDDANRGHGGFNEQIEYLERITTNLHTSVMKVRMVPLESVVNRFPRMIRDLSKKLDKKMELYISGEETELDRTVIDEIGDPLLHLLRNAADHGLETNEERVAAGKPEVGSIFLNAYQEGNNVVIEVRDDGKGIDAEKIKQKAIAKGTITEEQAEAMTDKEIIDLLFRPSFSTAEKISDVSGRGVGLDVVKTKIESLGGDVEVRTTLGQGSNFIIHLPLTLAIIQSLMVELGSEKYAIPLGSIQTIEDIPVSDVKYVQTKEVIHLRGAVIPLIRLNEVLDVESSKKSDENLTVVIVTKGDKQAGFVVDNLIGQQEIVIKSIGKYINNTKMISGATILGDGEVALILDVNTLI
ncbi:MAG: chemotaxis protein CheA [Lachnospiraceae bacterium]|nr:chemotaxis protein CheA [Lachnospiraceae bacterium]